MRAKWLGGAMRYRFYKYFLSYVAVIVVLLLIVGGIVYKGFFTTLSEEVQDHTIANLTGIKDAMDTKISEMNRMALQISSDPVLTPFMVEENGYALNRTVKELKTFKSTNMFIRDLLIYYPSQHPDRLYGSSGTYNADDFFEYVYKFTDWGKSNLDGIVTEMKAPMMKPIETVMVNKVNPMQLSVYIHPLSMNRENRYGTLLFLIEESSVRSIVQAALQHYDGFMYILDERNNQVFRLANGERDEAEAAINQRIMSGQSAKTVDTLSVHGRNYSIIRLQSNYNHWSYITVMPTDQFMGKVERSRMLFLYTISAVFVIGLLMAFALSLNNYRPLQRLITKLKIQYPIHDSPRQTDEYDLIYHAVGEISREKEGLLHRLNSQGAALKEQHLLSLLYGRMKPEDVEDTFAHSNVILDKPFFTVLMFLIDDCSKFKRSQTESMQLIVKYSLLKMIEDLSFESGAGYGIELPDNRGFVLLLNLNEGFDDMRHPAELAAKAKDLFRQYASLSVTAGIGGIYDDIGKTYQSFLEAGQAARYRFIQGGDRIILYEDIRHHDQKSVFWHPLEQESEIVRAIKGGRSNEAEAVICDIIGNIVRREIPLRAAELICFDIVNTIIKTFIELEIHSSEQGDGRLEDLLAAEFETMEELENMLIGLCRHLCSYIGKATEGKQTGLTEKILAYITDHYCDHSLSLDSISGQFGLSPSYVTRLFKETEGQSLMRYIDAMRMNRAKELLRCSDAPLKDIIAEVGYMDATNFIRKFKKNEGLTPIQYRTVVRADHNLEKMSL
ncbi:helix-turn-helix domain-containing protein [Paenibacillus dendrobii]|nr:helix-turn-helix domain-containing protein [Paenibacillus dendrobii]